MTTSIDDLGTQITELAAHITAATCYLLDLLREFDERKGWARDGCFSCANWLGWKCGIGRNAAGEKLRVAHALAKLPKIHAAFSHGEVSYSKARLTAEDGARFKAALETLTQEMFDEGSADLSHETLLKPPEVWKASVLMSMPISGRCPFHL